MAGFNYSEKGKSSVRPASYGILASRGGRPVSRQVSSKDVETEDSVYHPEIDPLDIKNSISLMTCEIECRVAHREKMAQLLEQKKRQQVEQAKRARHISY